MSLVAAACTTGISTDTAAPVDQPGGDPPSTTSPAVRPTLEGVDRVISGDMQFPDGFEVSRGEVWAFDPAVSTTVEVGGNVVVLGTLRLRPDGRSIEHTLRFVGIDEDSFVGGGADVLDSDVGLWIMGEGRLDTLGSPRTAWGHEWLDEWDGDEVIAAPHTQGDYTTFAPIEGAADVPAANALGYETELLNLTRNVRIEGTPEGKTHIFIRSSQPQSIRHTAIRYVAPAFGEMQEGSREQGAEQRPVGADITGRYGLHFHFNAEGSRGSIVEGVVIRDADNHAFVPHASHGITLSNTISFNTANAAYWWDPRSRSGPDNASNDIVYDHAVAALVRTGDRRDAAFNLADGENNTIFCSIAVGVQASGSSNSGFRWPGTEQGVWRFEDNLAHNNEGHGIFVWQNTGGSHVIEGFTAYLNDRPGIAHGAYRNSYVYRNVTLRDNDQRGGGDIEVQAHATGRPTGDGGGELQEWENIDSGGATVLLTRHALPPEAPVRFRKCDFSAIIVDDGERNPSIWEFVDCDIGPDDITVRYMHPDSILRIQDGDDAWQLTPAGDVIDIEPFVMNG